MPKALPAELRLGQQMRRSQLTHSQHQRVQLASTRELP
jgi:hypothetical protein